MMISLACLVAALTPQLEVVRDTSAAIQRRQAIPAVEIHWDAHLTVIGNPDAVRDSRQPVEYQCPPQTFAVANGCVRYRGFRDPFYQLVQGELTEFASYFDGRDSVTYRLAKDPPGMKWGEIRQQTQFTDSQNLTFGPLWLHFGTDDLVGVRLQPEHLTLLPDEDTVDGHFCRVFAGQRGRNAFRIFVAPELDFSIVRYMEMSGGGGLCAYEVDTKFKHEDGRVVPSSWSAKWYSRLGFLRQSLNASVQRVTFGPKDDDDHLRLRFPEGTTVVDHSEGIVYQVNSDGSYQLKSRKPTRRGLPPVHRVVPREQFLHPLIIRAIRPREAR